MAIINRIPSSAWTSSLIGLPNPAAALLQLLEPAPKPTGPAVNMYAGKDQLSLSARLPGVNPSQLEISLESDVLHLSARASKQADGEQGDVIFERSFRMPFRMDPDSIEAVLRDGLLTVSARRNPADAPRTITINSPAN